MSLKNMLVALAVIVLMGGCQSLETTQVSASQIEPTIAISQDSDGDGVIDDLDWCPATPPRVMIDNNGCPPTLFPFDSIKKEVRVYYDKGSSEISHQYLEDLDKAGKILQSREDTVITIEGHISEDEDTAANQTLAQIRAEGVKNYLMLKYGVEAERIKTFTYGAKRPLAPNDDVEGAQLNRRVYALVKNVEQD